MLLAAAFLKRHVAIRNLRFALPLCLLLSPVPCLQSPCVAQDDPFAAGVRPTPRLKPEEEQKLFKLPEGFEIQLVAAEPDIQKPLNMAFDEKGRIWLTCTVEYPYAAPLDKPGRDSIRVLEDTDGDGRFEKVSVFADGLNIPMGIYPWKGGCVAYSIPDITHFEDTDGDGKCDKRTRLYGPFDHTRDTHGMVNAMRRGFDGWVYACHGFNNDSHVKGADGHEVHLNSGNTFRFKLDGSRIEHFTHGQVNPFGMCFDELFNIFTADCHSKPIYQLIRGGYYPSFGKPHDGLGFVPPMMDHLHGSTAICGLAIYTGENFPQEYRGQFFSGNVMTSRINRNKPQYHGSTIKAVEQPDFLIAGDPWFRPVDIQIGPDGAMYVLDFYNRIIGHYEVPLPHPGRDRTSGRIWRVAYTGKGTGDRRQGTEGAVGNAVPGAGAKPATRPSDLTKMSVAELIDELSSPQLEYRLRVLNYLADVKGEASLAKVKQAFRSPRSPLQQIGAMWVLHRLGDLNSQQRGTAAIQVSRDVRLHAMKVLPELKMPRSADLRMAKDGLDDRDPFVVRAAADALGQHPAEDSVRPLDERLMEESATKDALLRLTLEMSLRTHLRQGFGKEMFVNAPRPTMLRKEAQARIVRLALATDTPEAGGYLVYHFLNGGSGELLPITRHIAAYAADEPLDDFLDFALIGLSAGTESDAKVALSFIGGLVVRGREPSEKAKEWCANVATKLLAEDSEVRIGWTAAPLEGDPQSESPWVIAPMPSADGDTESPFYYSLPKGEQRTGIYRSGAFSIRSKLSFWCAGHSGFPGKPLNDGNYVRLRDATTHAVLAETRPPRNDVAHRVEWDLSRFAPPDGELVENPRRVYVELVDGDSANAYAWLAVGRFSLSFLNPNNASRKQQLAAEIIGNLKLQSLRPKLLELFGSSIDGAARVAIGQALVSLSPDTRAAALVAAMADPSFPAELVPRAVYAINVDHDEEYLDNLKEVMKRAPTRLQTSLAETLAGDAAGAETLLGLVKAGVASPRLLTSANVKAKLDALKNDKLSQQVAAITANLPAQNEIIDKLVVERRAAYPRAKPNLEKGTALFEKHCAACHQIAGKGSVIGPQLDGIGLRGLERLVEDVLDPNRNVDVAFRTTTIRTVNGEVISGLVRREEGATLILADNKGKEVSVPKEDIEEQAKGSLSLMPANVHEIVSEAEFYDLLAYLLGQKEAKEPAGNKDRTTN